MSIDNPSYLLTEMKNNLLHKITQAVHNEIEGSVILPAYKDRKGEES